MQTHQDLGSGGKTVGFESPFAPQLRRPPSFYVSSALAWHFHLSTFRCGNCVRARDCPCELAQVRAFGSFDACNAVGQVVGWLVQGIFQRMKAYRACEQIESCRCDRFQLIPCSSTNVFGRIPATFSTLLPIRERRSLNVNSFGQCVLRAASPRPCIFISTRVGPSHASRVTWACGIRGSPGRLRFGAASASSGPVSRNDAESTDLHLVRQQQVSRFHLDHVVLPTP